MRRGLTVVGAAFVALLLCVLAPLRQTSGDTVGGRLGAANLRCGGGFDLARIDWIRQRTQQGRFLYWLQQDATGDVTSIFGPAPAVVGGVALLDFGDGDRIADRSLRVRERATAAVLIAFAVLGLMFAVAARRPWKYAVGAGLLASASFAGAATLGQGLWQATVALPLLMAGWAAIEWRTRSRLAAALAPALLLLAAMIRPTILPLALCLGVAWAFDTRSWKLWAVATLLALMAVFPLLVWNTSHLQTPLSLGQWHGNTRLTDDVFVFSRAHIGYALGGLLVSPGRGLVWFAPILFIGVVMALRQPDRTLRVVAIGVLLQIALISCFFKWYGGLAYGPRLLAEAVWLGIGLAFATSFPQRRSMRALVGVAVALTLLSGQLGLWRFRPEQWETRRMLLEIDENALWDFVDSPIAATLRSTEGELDTYDTLPTRALVCHDGYLESIR